MIEAGRSNLHPLHDEFADLRAEALRWVAGGAAALAWGIVWVWALSADLTGLQDVLVAAILAISAGLAWILADRSYIGAAAVLTLGLVAGSVAAAVLWSTGQLVYALPLILFLTPLLIGYWHTLLVSIGEIALVGALATLRLVPLPGTDVSLAVLLIVLGAGLSWVAYQPVRRMLDWTWASYLEERRKTREVRERQAELAQLSKSLEEACGRLEQANQALAEARRAADEARRLKDEFAMAISHELRTPINLIIGFSEMIVDDADERIPAAFRRDVETIYRNACHLSTLVDDVLDLGRLEAHRLALVKQWSAVPRIVQEAIDAVRGLYDNAGLRIKVDLPGDLPSLYVDPTRIRQVLINLLTNAVRYVEEGGVQISARCDGSEVIVSVADTGVGIPPEDLPRVFERFHQTGQLRRRGGFGLGLTVSKQLIELHAGSMWVTSEVNHGTTFSFSLPVVTNVAPLASNPRLALLEGQHLDEASIRTVLVVGQDSEAVRVFRRYLDGYQIQEAATTEDVRGLARKARIDAVVVANSVTDEVSHVLHDRFGGAPLIRCSLHTITRASRQLGVSAFLTKPVSAEQLRQTFRQLKLRPRRVLVVDDDPDMVRMLARMLRGVAPRCHVQTATSGEEGLAMAAAAVGQRPEVVLLDLLMPEMDGRTFIQEWHAEPALRGVPIVVVSAASEEDHDLVIGESVEIRRHGGLRVHELMRVVQGSLDTLLSVPGVAAIEPLPAGARWGRGNGGIHRNSLSR